MSFGGNTAPVRRLKEAVKREWWSCECAPIEGFSKMNHPALKRCGTCGQARPNTNAVMSATPRRLEKADYPALLRP